MFGEALAALARHLEPTEGLHGVFKRGACNGHSQCGVQQVLRIGLQRTETLLSVGMRGMHHFKPMEVFNGETSNAASCPKDLLKVALIN